ncbi:ABC transporter ATP-binding protein [Rhabdothermincola sediminis]|uniref:ABC transporter ATP-binding protein n=1 Tax=Rhabdothermincola sediminis TaxID=2751370 RepID=UPI001AA0AFC3|nr:ABC transporter ATP-binding protein [Rhabdothermincola sediminis]
MSLVVDGVWKGFATRSGTQWVLRDVSLTIEPGEFIALIGHSGCGKSTLLSALGGLLPVDAGRIALDGEEVRAPGPDRAIVFQRYSLLPRLSLARNVAVAVRSSRRSWSKAKVDEAVERTLRAVGLWEHRDKKPHQVSGGMQQRCAVARAFAVEPRALLLDEPFGALDALTRARLQGLLVDLWSSESDTELVAMVTHGVDEAILLADRVVVMSGPPGPSIIDVIDVDIPRPRNRVTIVDDPGFRAAQARLLALLERDTGWDAA